MSKKMVTDENFDAELAACKTPYMVEFFATWCGHCKRMAPIIEELAAEFDGKVMFFLADVDAAMKKTEAFNVMATPTMVFFKNGQKMQQLAGEKEKTVLQTALNALL